MEFILSGKRPPSKQECEVAENGPRMTRIGRIFTDQDKEELRRFAFCLDSRQSAQSASSVAH
jgi:hypothetical protein